MLFVLLEVVEVLLLDVAPALVGNYLPHQVYRRIVLATVFHFLLLHHHFAEQNLVRVQLDGTVNLRLFGIHGHNDRLVAYTRHLELVVILVDIHLELTI